MVKLRFPRTRKGWIISGAVVAVLIAAALGGQPQKPSSAASVVGTTVAQAGSDSGTRSVRPVAAHNTAVTRTQTALSVTTSTVAKVISTDSSRLSAQTVTALGSSQSRVTRTTPTMITAVPADVEQISSTSATALLAALPVKGRAPMTGYTRAQFGAAWTDDNDDIDGHNGCDTRNDILRRDLTAVTLEPGTHACAVATGILVDPYTATTIHFLRGATSTAVQIDHVTALGDAWQTGAQQLSARTRVDLANDPLELLAVDGPTNERKGDGDAATWLPPNKNYRCAYVARQIAVKVRYRLWVTPAEHDAMARVLAACNNPTVPAETGTPPMSDAVATPISPTTGPPAPQPATVPTGVSIHAPTSPAGATAICDDGTYSYSAHHQGSCSHHGGVAQFLP